MHDYVVKSSIACEIISKSAHIHTTTSSDTETYAIVSAESTGYTL